MKKQYGKPQIRYESFVLTSSVAANCSKQGSVSFADVDNCGFYTDYDANGDGKADTIFSNACDIPYECYHTAAEELGVFGS